MIQWLALQHLPWAPAWFQAWQHRWRIAYLERTLVPAMEAAQEAGSGQVEAWASPETPASDVLDWIAEQIAGTPRPLAQSADRFRIILAAMSAEEWEQVQQPGVNLHLPTERVLATWDGHRDAWWWEGHEQITAAIPAAHSGIYIALHAVAVTFTAALTPPAPEE